MTEPSANQALEEYLHDLLCESGDDARIVARDGHKSKAQFEKDRHIEEENEDSGLLDGSCDIDKQTSASAGLSKRSEYDLEQNSSKNLKSKAIKSQETEAQKIVRKESPPALLETKAADQNGGAPTTTLSVELPPQKSTVDASSGEQNTQRFQSHRNEPKSRAVPLGTSAEDRSNMPVLSQERKICDPLTLRQKHSVETLDEALLEDIKRRKLQEMLSRQTGESLRARVETKTQVVTKPHVRQAQTAAQTDVDHDKQDQQKREPSPLLAWGKNGKPVWGEGSFEVLLFEVSGLSLAVPLVSLGQIVPISEKLTVLHGQSDWFMGILPSHVGDIRCVNTALFVMPERYKESFLNTAKYVVTIDGMSWGLAVDSVKQPITLSPDDVKWRTRRSQRPWLAGTVKSHMCALIDIPQMGELLQSADKNYRSPQ